MVLLTSAWESVGPWLFGLLIVCVIGLILVSLANYFSKPPWKG